MLKWVIIGWVKTVQKFKRAISLCLCLILAFSCIKTFNVKAISYPAMAEIASSSGAAKIYDLPGTKGHNHIDTLYNGTQVKVLGIESDIDGDKWYKINYGDNFSKAGYGVVSRIAIKYEYKYDADFEQNLTNFPESYHSYLRELHAKYPNWKFVANNLDLTFKNAVESQYSVTDVKRSRKLVELTFGGNEWRDMRAYDAATDTWLKPEPRWTYASRAAVEYYMDPRNSLNENMIFAFMQQSYQEDSNITENLRTIIKGTFLERGYDGNADAYINDIINAAKSSGVSPYVLAATIVVEQGTGGTSQLISGTYQGYEGYYNFFNFAASGATQTEIITSGLTYAQNSGWNSRYAAIEGGAKKYADGYISIGQDTYYYKDFNVIKEDWNHQYAQALYDAWTNANYLKKGCISNADAVITFLIPVFTEMPTTACPIPSDVILPDDITVAPSTKKGDPNFDGNIDIIDLAMIKMYILQTRALSGDELTAADINNDGSVDIIDLAAVKNHILQIKSIE